MDAREERVARNEIAFREVNERIEESHSRFGAEGRQEFLCECGHAECAERILLTLDEYEGVRADGRRFALVGGHEILGVERIVERADRFVIVEKIGRGARVAAEEDPRGGDAAAAT